MRIVVFKEGGQEIGRLTWDGEQMHCTAPPVLLKDLEDGIGDGDEDYLPHDGDPFLDAVLQEFASGYLYAEELTGAPPKPPPEADTQQPVAPKKPEVSGKEPVKPVLAVVKPPTVSKEPASVKPVKEVP